jgi:hypothetical protein
MKTVHSLKIVAMFPLAFLVLVSLLFGVGEMLGGDISDAGHLIPVVFVGLVIWLCWKRPLWGGILLLLGAAISWLKFRRVFLSDNTAVWVSPLVIMILPLVFSGFLLLTAEWMGRIHKAT